MMFFKNPNIKIQISIQAQMTQCQNLIWDLICHWGFEIWIFLFFFIPFLIIKCKMKMMAIFPLLKRVSRFMFQVSRFL